MSFDAASIFRRKPGEMVPTGVRAHAVKAKAWGIVLIARISAVAWATTDGGLASADHCAGQNRVIQTAARITYSFM